jgi:regulator of sigma E protease
MPETALQKIQYSPIAAIPYAFQEVINLTQFNFVLFGKMLTGKLSLDSLGGPIAIFDNAGISLNYGFIPFLGFLAFLSVSIGAINILPIPGLDGGHLAIQTIESIIRRPISDTVVTYLYRAGFLFIFFISLHAFINDVQRML